MKKSKLLIALLCGALLSPLTACEETTSGGNGKTPGGNTGSQVEEDLNKALTATKKKLADTLDGDLLSLTFDVSVDLGLDITIAEEQSTVVVETIACEDAYEDGSEENKCEYAWDLEDTKVVSSVESKVSETVTLGVDANIDLKYYLDQASETPAGETNDTEFYLIETVSAAGVAETDDESYAASIEAYYKNDTFVQYANNEYMSSTLVSTEDDPTIGYAISELQSIVDFGTLDEVLDYVLAAFTTGEDDAYASTMKIMVETVLSYLNGDVTSAEMVELLAVLYGYESADEIPADLKQFVIGVLDYVQTLDLTSLLTLSSSTLKGVTYYTITFNYTAFKTLVGKLFDDLAAIATQVGSEDSLALASYLAQYKPMVLAYLPETVAFTETLGVENGVLSYTKVDVEVDLGEDLENAFPLGGSSMSIEWDAETGAPVNGQTVSSSTTYMNALDLTIESSFSFGNTAVSVPTLTVPAN